MNEVWLLLAGSLGHCRLQALSRRGNHNWNAPPRVVLEPVPVARHDTKHISGSEQEYLRSLEVHLAVVFLWTTLGIAKGGLWLSSYVIIVLTFQSQNWILKCSYCIERGWTCWAYKVCKETLNKIVVGSITKGGLWLSSYVIIVFDISESELDIEMFILHREGMDMLGVQGLLRNFEQNSY